MSNWFENNPTKSIIAYTIFIAGATWAASTFILQDSRLLVLQAELQSQKTLTEQYKSKTDLLQRDIDQLRADNTEYRNWLGNTKDAIPAVVPRINELKKQIADLGISISSSNANGVLPVSLSSEQTVSIGRAFVNESIGVTFTVRSISAARTADVKFKLPDRIISDFETVEPGDQWKFRVNNTEYSLTVLEVSFVADTVQIRISKIQ